MGDAMPAEVAAMFEEYRTLRDEIGRCITIQSQTVIAGGAILGGTLAFAPSVAGVVFVIPLFVIIVGALWVIEQSRMMRAGNYLQVLEDRINCTLKAQNTQATIGWENWLRGDPRSRFSAAHYQMQHYGIFGVLFLVESLSLVEAWLARGTASQQSSLVSLGKPGLLTAYTAVCGLLTLYIVFKAWVLVQHEVQRKKRAIKEELLEYQNELRMSTARHVSSSTPED